MSSPEYVPRKEFEQRHSDVLVLVEALKGEVVGLRVEQERILKNMDNSTKKMDDLNHVLADFERDLAVYKSSKNTVILLTAVCSSLATLLAAVVVHI